MSIPSQLPQLVAAARSSALQALALQAGQVLDGKVIGPAPNGGTQVQISGQMLNLVLPIMAKAGDVLHFEVQGSGAQVKLALQAAQPPMHQATAAASLPTNNPPPLVSVSAAPIPPAQGQTTVSANSANAPAVSAPQTPAGAALPAPVQANGTVAAAPLPTPRHAVPVPSYPVAALPRPTAAVPQGSLQALPIAAQQGVVTGGKPQIVQVTSQVPAPVVATSTPIPSTPQAALSQMVQAALPRQDSIASLTVALTGLVGKVALPEPVMRAAQQVLARQVQLQGGKLDGQTLQAAVQRSGIFQEALLAKGGTPAPTAQADLKAGLLALRQTLTTWLGPQAALTPAAQVAPPIRGHVPRAKAGEIAPLDLDAAPEEVGKHVLERTEGALSRVRLHQSLSLQDPLAKQADWSMELPVLIGQHQTHLQLQIHRDQEDEGQQPSERGWQMRFALNMPGLGEVGAQVLLRAGTTGVMLWAAERETSDAIEREIGSLREAFLAIGLNPGAIIVRHGEPPAPPPARSGHLVDASS